MKNGNMRHHYIAGARCWRSLRVPRARAPFKVSRTFNAAATAASHLEDSYCARFLLY